MATDTPSGSVVSSIARVQRIKLRVGDWLRSHIYEMIPLSSSDRMAIGDAGRRRFANVKLYV